VSKDGRLRMIVSRLSAAGGHFDEVIEAIDKMVATLKEEEADDLKQKETCEQDRMDNTRDAIKTSRTMDELTEAIAVLKSEIEEAEKDKAEAEAEVESIKKELEELTKIRESENKEFLIAKADDEAASELVAQATGVLETFYKENDLMLSQTAARQPFVSEAGKAPPPPPTTWDAPYQGKTDESTGIIAVLGMIKEDIDKDLEKATTAEKEAQALFDETKKEMEGQMEKLDKLINELTLTISKKEGEVTDNKEDRMKEKEKLVAVMKTIKDAEPGCDYFTINFPLRSKDRSIEIDGLIKAKAILQGAKFDKGPDPSRELKPGDAFVQTQLRR